MQDDARRFFLENPDAFLARYFGHRLNHRLESFHLQLIDTATVRRRGLVLYPAAHGKTTIVSTLLPIWALCADPNIRVSIITKNDRDAKGIMQAIMAELLGNEELIADFGPFKTEDKNVPWGLEKLSVAKRTRRAKEPTVMAFGSGSNTALGSRADWVICDDIVTEKNSATPEMRAKLKEWFQLGPETQAEEYDDRLTVVGTLFDPADLYHDLIELADPEDGVPIWHVDHFDAITDEEAHETLWPARWPWKRLMMEKASKGTLAFNKRYRNIAVDPSRMVFREEYIKGLYIGRQKYPGCLDRDFVIGDVEAGLCHRVVAGFDPAVGTGRHAKFCAHLTLGKGSCIKHPDGCYWVIDLKRDQMTMRQQMDHIIDTHVHYNLFASIIEDTSFQKGLKQEVLERTMEAGLALKIEGHNTGRHNKHDPEIGVEAMSPIFENGLVHIPWGNPESMRKMQQFVDELVQYPTSKTTDTVMAFWFAYLALRENAPRYASAINVPRQIRWAVPTGRRTIKNPYYADKETVQRVGDNDMRSAETMTAADGGPIPKGALRG